ncbi:hypothetical protein LHGZ1_0653 [Laribacter hongkongensis]|uniref:Uncharacterized protein n=1 Tax=Laribacter hongkongensis TaxID=168471 RepID=A0A248LG65_9NEIS|nr:hypothetical protein LHGZ1_0653 [Laribacter hongkongensis]
MNDRLASQHRPRVLRRRGRPYAKPGWSSKPGHLTPSRQSSLFHKTTITR